MGRSRCIALGFLVALVLVAAGVGWQAVRPVEVGASTGMTRLDDSPQPAPREGGLAQSLPSEPELSTPELRETKWREVLVSQIAPPESAEESELVLVHGQVRRSGRPVADYDLVFQPSGEGANRNDDDWDSTDADGRYEVELRSDGRYVVLNDDEGAWVTEMTVPAGKRELILDIDLPRGN